MDSNDFSLIHIGHEDDTLLRNLPPDAAGGFTCSPLVISGSAAASRSRPPKTSELQLKLGASNLSLEPLRMKRGGKAGGCNLRTSLAWNKALFTEEGVLSSLELSMISGTPCKLDGKDLSAICEEQRTPIHTRITPADFQTIESKAPRKLSSSSNRENKRAVEGLILKQKSLASVSLGSFNTRITSNAPKIVSQRIPKASKSSDQRTRKKEKSSTNHQASNVKQINSSEVTSSKIFPVGLKANDGPSKVALSVYANSGNTFIIGQPVQHQVAKPSGLRMPSPSLQFSEPKISMSNSLGQRNMQPSNLSNSGIPISHNLGATCNGIQSNIPKATMGGIHDSGPIQPCSSSSVSHNLAAKRNIIQSKIPKTSMDRVPDSGPVSSINSPKLHDESVQCKSNELVVGAQTLFSEKPLEQISNTSLEEVDKPFLEHEHTSLSIEGADRKDNRSVSPIRECKFNGTDLFQCSGDQLIIPGMGKVSDFHVKQGQYDLPVTNKGYGSESELEEYAIVQTPLKDDCSVEMPSRISLNKEVQELQCPSHVMDQVPQGYDGLSSNIEDQLKRSFSPERGFDNDAAHNIMEEDKVDKLQVAREELSASLEKIVDTANKQQKLQVLQCPLPVMDKPVQCADRSTVEDGAFRIVTDEDKMSDAIPLDSALSTSLDTMPRVQDHVDPSVSEYSNDTYVVGQNAHFEPQMSPRACKSISQVDAVICDAEFSFYPVQGLDSTVAQLSMDGIDQQHKNFDELVMEPLVPAEATLASLKNKHSSKDLVTLEDRKLRHKEELHFSPSTISAEPLMPDQVISGSFENQHSKDLVSIGGPELSFQAEFQLNPSTCEDQTIQAAAVYTLEGPNLVNETMQVSLGKDMCEKDLVIRDGRELIYRGYMEILLLPNKNENQTANSPAINNTEAYSPHSSGYVCLPLKASGDCSIRVDKLETDSQMNQEPQNPSLDTEQVGNRIILIDSSSRKDRSSDQTFLKELQLSPRTGEDCTRSSVVNCDIKVSSFPCKINSASVRNASRDESDERFESANQHKVFHDTDNEDAKIRPKILMDGKNQPQLVIRPPSDVAPFSDEWLAAIEAAGEELLNLKTGPVQNSPPAKLSPEPGPWSPVKRKNNQGIGPYDCTKYTGGQQ